MCYYLCMRVLGQSLREIVKRVLTLGTLIAMAVIVVELIIIRFASTGITAKATGLNKRSQEIQQESSILELQRRLEAEAKQAEVLEPLLKKRLASQNDLLGFSRELGDIAGAVNVNVVPAFTGESQGGNGRFGSTGVTLTVDGRWNDIISFLDALNSSRFIVRLTNIDLSRLGDEGIYRLSGRGEVVYRRQ